MTVSFVVHGIPAPQGSKTPWGTEANPNTRPWRAAVAADAVAAMDGAEPMVGPLILEALFVFPRPKGHYGTGKNAELLKQSAPFYFASKPDTDKLLRAVGDALTGIVCRDDSQFVVVIGEKMYGRPRAEIKVRAAGSL